MSLELDADHPSALLQPREDVGEAALGRDRPAVEGDKRRPVRVAVLLVPEWKAVDVSDGHARWTSAAARNHRPVPGSLVTIVAPPELVDLVDATSRMFRAAAELTDPRRADLAPTGIPVRDGRVIVGRLRELLARHDALEVVAGFAAACWSARLNSAGCTTAAARHRRLGFVCRLGRSKIYGPPHKLTSRTDDNDVPFGVRHDGLNGVDR
jgi:hypothetical protein